MERGVTQAGCEVDCGEEWLSNDENGQLDVFMFVGMV